MNHLTFDNTSLTVAWAPEVRAVNMVLASQPSYPLLETIAQTLTEEKKNNEIEIL